ncbi:MAG: MauE/DoxX family redox-associated membrane protein [Candidatus Latescibacteria bacterium]|jgi:uncharacterized membrane protein YphA (DoxX/SURF4 family)|nr:MauE/DoxX family redox-associated membrane protein [Candidatus Latescibacterota bacterium]
MTVRSTRLPSALLVAIRLILGCTMLWAGLTKISEPLLFAQTVRAYEVLPLALINPFAIVVPWIEVVAGVCLVLGYWTRSGSVVSLGLLIAFGVALGINVARGADLACGCFALDGSGGSLYGALVRDLLLLTGAAILFASHAAPFSLDSLLSRPVCQRG